MSDSIETNQHSKESSPIRMGSLIEESHQAGKDFDEEKFELKALEEPKTIEDIKTQPKELELKTTNSSRKSRKWIWISGILTVVSIILIGIALGLYFGLKDKDSMYVNNIPGEVSHLLTTLQRCYNFTVINRDGVKSDADCKNTDLEITRVNQRGDKDTSSLMLTKRKENGENDTNLFQFFRQEGKRMLMVRKLEDNMTCLITDPGCKDSLNNLPIIHIEYDKQTNGIKKLLVPSNLTDEQKLDLITQASHIHPDLNKTLVNTQDQAEEKSFDSKRGDETFSGELSESLKNSTNTEITYKLKNSSNSNIAPAENEQKTVIDNENKRIIESVIKESRSLSQGNSNSQNKDGSRILLETGDSDSMSLSASVESKTKFLSAESQSDLPEIIEEVKKHQDLETYTLENVTKIAEKVNKQRNNITDDVVKEDVLIMDQKDSEFSNSSQDSNESNASSDQSGQHRVLASETIYSDKFQIFVRNILGVDVSAECNIALEEGDQDRDIMRSSLDLLLNSKFFMRLVSFEGKVPGTPKTILCRFLKGKKEVETAINSFKTLVDSEKAVLAKILDQVGYKLLESKVGALNKIIDDMSKTDFDTEATDLVESFKIDLLAKKDAAIEVISGGFILQTYFDSSDTEYTKMITKVRKYFKDFGVDYSTSADSIISYLYGKSFASQSARDGFLTSIKSAFLTYNKSEATVKATLKQKYENLHLNVQNYNKALFDVLPSDVDFVTEFGFLKTLKDELVTALSQIIREEMNKIFIFETCELIEYAFLNVYQELVSLIKQAPINPSANSAELIDTAMINSQYLSNLLGLTLTNEMKSNIELMISPHFDIITDLMKSYSIAKLSGVLSGNKVGNLGDKAGDLTSRFLKFLSSTQSTVANLPTDINGILNSVYDETKTQLLSITDELKANFDSMAKIPEVLTTCKVPRSLLGSDTSDYDSTKDELEIVTALNDILANLPQINQQLAGFDTNLAGLKTKIDNYSGGTLKKIELLQKFTLDASSYSAKITEITKTYLDLKNSVANLKIEDTEKSIIDNINSFRDTYIAPKIETLKTYGKTILSTTIKNSLNNLKKELVSKLSNYYGSISAEKSLKTPIIQFCFAVSTVSICGKVNIKMTYGIVYSASTSKKGVLTTSVIPYLDADIEANAAVDVTVLKAGVVVQGSIAEVEIPINLRLDTKRLTTSLVAKAKHDEYSYTINGWYQIPSKCKSNQVCIQLWVVKVCITCNSNQCKNNSPTSSFLQAGGSGKEEEVSLVDKYLE